GQFAKSMPFTSARNTHHKHQYRESGFVQVRSADITPSRGKCPVWIGNAGELGPATWEVTFDQDKAVGP
ncbi:hypothetical protein, partial [Sulfitobacter sp. EhC04]|uniref:hypothetical protein n=1 Tax=Sulfitobacter sp. EhC04 TaxID=1849168 RepID=UPI001F3932AC